MTIRLAGPGDGPALARLAALDSQRPLRGEVLVAEVDGALRAACAIDGGAVVADPFVRTAQLVELLSARVGQLTTAGRPAARRGVRLAGRLGLARG